MSFNPFTEKGRPIEKQVMSWAQLAEEPFDKDQVHPYTRTRAILMNGIEVDAAFFLHNCHRHSADPDLRRKLALARRIEQQQQKRINWLNPASQSVLETTIGYEQVAVDLTAFLARTETDSYVKSALDFALVEDFDHLYRYTNLMEDLDFKTAGAAAIVKDLTEIMPGRPTVLEHRHPFDSVREPIDKDSANPLTKLHVLTIIAAEQQTMNFYMNVGATIAHPVGRALYQEIAQIEEQHVTHYGSLDDPTASWFEMLATREYNECWLYYSCMQTETDPRIRQIWQQCLEDEIEHLKMARELMMQYEKKDPAEKFPKELPAPLVFESNKEYVRKTLQAQFPMTAQETEFVLFSKANNRERYTDFLEKVNNRAQVPSQETVSESIRKLGEDYRLEIEGPHPVEFLRERSEVPSAEELLLCLSPEAQPVQAPR